jgi:cell wall-associated NlpC family hydrolase
MELLALLMIAAGGMLSYGGVTGRSPIQMLVSIASGSVLSAGNTWLPITPINNADYTATFGIVPNGPETTDSPLHSPINSGSVSSDRQKVINFALAQRGEPYVWDAAGPNAWDCSGLTMKAYAQVGVILPHHAASQERMGRAVSLAEAQPADLIFWGAVSGHVAMYLGNGRVVHAPHTGTVVKESDLWDQKDIRVRSYLASSQPATGRAQ